MKETITEYSRILIVLLSFGMMIAFIFGGTWFHQIGKASNAMENRVVIKAQDKAFDNMAGRTNPTIDVTGIKIKTGQVIDLKSLVNDTRDCEGNNLIGKIKISCNNDDFSIENNRFLLTPSKSGIYKVTYSISDAYGLKTTETVNVTVE